MNEKTKTILTHIACALGGMTLGIALLGGLSYCSVSEKAEKSEINTILASPKGERINTGSTGGNYDGWRFTIPSFESISGNYCRYRYGTMDYRTYTYTELDVSGEISFDWSNMQTEVDSILQVARPSADSQLRFVMIQGVRVVPNANPIYWLYASFLYNQSYDWSGRTFLITNLSFSRGIKLSGENAWASGGSSYYVLNAYENDLIVFNIGDDFGGTTLTFQDVDSYYKSIGYGDGYEEGETTGYNSGYEVGYSDGSETGRMFTALGLNQTTWYKSDLTPTSTSETSNFYKLLEFKDGDNEEWGVAAELFTTDDLFKVDLYKNINQGYTSATYYGTLGEGTMTYVGGVWQVEMTPATYYFYEWAQITEVYNNSLPLNYFLLTGTPQNATGYQQGYQAGYQAGILATPGGEATNNVFSLFTSAFDSVGGFFNLKIFGFLPLYWFFLAPLFVALITLLLRMVKH